MLCKKQIKEKTQKINIKLISFEFVFKASEQMFFVILKETLP